MQPEDILLLGVGGLIVLNRVYTSTELKRFAWAYAVLQALNLAAAITLFAWKLEGYPPQLDLGVRAFLSFFVAWHMVLANNERAATVRRVRDERRPSERVEADPD